MSGVGVASRGPAVEVPVLKLYRIGAYQGAELVCGHRAFPLTPERIEQLRSISRRWGTPMEKCQECSVARFGG